MIEENKIYWFNFKTGEYEYIETPKDFTDYIPQQSAAINLYRLLIKTGNDPLHAAIRVLSVCIGEK